MVFTRCKFNLRELPLKVEVRFDRCHFNDQLDDELHFDPSYFKSIEKLTVFDNCHFFKPVKLVSYEKENDLRSQKSSCEVSLFQGCNFWQELSITHLVFKAPIILDDVYGRSEACLGDGLNDERDGFIKKLSIQDSIFEDEANVYVNNYRLDSVVFLRTKFKGKFEFKDNLVNGICIDDCNFERVSDFFRSEFEVFTARKTVFSDFAAFEETAFGVVDQLDKNPSVFKYVTFKEFSNFRSAKFYDGLDVEKANFAQPPNFLGVFVEPLCTRRETFRIIKYSFDTVGNHVEANQFYAYEMEAYRRELKKSNNMQEKLLLAFNGLVSNHGQSYLRPICFAIIAILILWTLKVVQENNWLYIICGSCYPGFHVFSEFVNGLVKDLPLFKHLMFSGVELLSLITSIFLSAFIWQALVAFRRHGRR